MIVIDQKLAGMISPEGEQVKFIRFVNLYTEENIRSIEGWILETEMRNSLRIQPSNSLDDYCIEKDMGS